jgi:hypothetical protein
MVAITHIAPELLDAAKARAVTLRQAAMRELFAKPAPLVAPRSKAAITAGKACAQC